MLSEGFKKLRFAFQSKTKEERVSFIQSLDKEEQLFFYKNPDLFLFDKQIIPDTTDWMYCLLRCGRGFGKSYAGSAWLAKKIRKGSKITALCGPTYDDVSKIMVPALLSWFLPSELAAIPYNHQTHTIKFKSGQLVYCFTSEKEIKGQNIEYLWNDEIATWCDSLPEKIQSRWEDIIRCVRGTKYPQIIITSTPKSHPFFIDFQEEVDSGNKNYIQMTGSMLDNPFLPESFREEQLRKYGNTSKGRQELFGDLITENPEALFHMQWINDNRLTSKTESIKSTNQEEHLKFFWQQVIDKNIFVKRIVIAVDPSGSNKKTSDETGIIILAQDMKNEVYVLNDLSGRHTPDQWAKLTRDAFYKYNALFPTCIVAETNFGGDIVISNIMAADHTLKPHIKEIKAFKSKLLRAEPAAAKYQRGKIHHVGYFEKLERQMCNYTGPNESYSPDRMDSIVHGINELIVVPQVSYRNIKAIESF